jgi:hypothetical protein
MADGMMLRVYPVAPEPDVLQVVPAPAPVTVWVGNLALTTSRELLVATLEQFGKVLKCEVKQRTGRKKDILRYAHVTLESAAFAAALVQHWHPLSVDGRLLSIEVMKEQHGSTRSSTTTVLPNTHGGSMA